MYLYPPLNARNLLEFKVSGAPSASRFQPRRGVICVETGIPYKRTPSGWHLCRFCRLGRADAEKCCGSQKPSPRQVQHDCIKTVAKPNGVCRPHLSMCLVGFRYILSVFGVFIALRCACAIGILFLSPLYPTYKNFQCVLLGFAIF